MREQSRDLGSPEVNRVMGEMARDLVVQWTKRAVQLTETEESRVLQSWLDDGAILVTAIPINDKIVQAGFVEDESRRKAVRAINVNPDFVQAVRGFNSQAREQYFLRLIEDQPDTFSASIPSLVSYFNKTGKKIVEEEGKELVSAKDWQDLQKIGEY